jgi:predicted aldo/keto reductase-like oxidoreductase
MAQSSSRRQFVRTLAGATAAMACHDAPSPNVPTSVTGTVPTRELGKTGVRVSMIGIGGSHIGKKLSEQQSIQLIRRAIDNGVTFLDNCWDYNEGQSELRMGKALRDGYRERVFLMTKLDGRTRDAAAAQLQQSLSRLQTDRLDLVQVHEVIRPDDPQRCFAPGGTMEALIEARKRGQVRFIGFTGHKDPQIHLAMLAEADRHGFEFDTVQMPLNVMDAHYNSFEANVLPVLLQKRIGVLGMKSMGSGDILDSKIVQPAECLRYALSLPTSVVISGMDSERVLDENLQTARNFSPLSSEERSALLARTEDAAREGKHELFKTSHKYDGTIQNPKWLEQAAL